MILLVVKSFVASHSALLFIFSYNGFCSYFLCGAEALTFDDKI